MTPAARISAAIEILDRLGKGATVEKCLTDWARRSRFAGSGDRAAVRDHVFAALRCRRSYAALGGGETGRALMIGMLRHAGAAPEDFFTGEGYAPPPLDDSEKAAGHAPVGNESCDLPDWLVPRFQAVFGPDLNAVCALMRKRAPVFLRVNPSRTTVLHVQTLLKRESIGTRPHGLSRNALEVFENPRKIKNSEAFINGLVELQDVASQALCEALPVQENSRVLDYCAGGGGKTLAMAGHCPARYYAYDANPARMKDLPTRAKRAGISVQLLRESDVVAKAPFDLVLCDVPCSGSGAWRRAPEGKWLLSPERLAALLTEQESILKKAAEYVSSSGVLAYATCSVFPEENEDQIARFLDLNPGWSLVRQQHFSPLDGGDGFFLAILKRT